jgi:hypothetical protein
LRDFVATRPEVVGNFDGEGNDTILAGLIDGNGVVAVLTTGIRGSGKSFQTGGLAQEKGALTKAKAHYKFLRRYRKCQ